MAGQKDWIISLIMFGMFVIALLMYMINFASDNNSYVDISDDPEINTLYSQSYGNVSNFQTDSENTYSSIINSTIAPGSLTTTGSGQYAITSGSALGTSKNVIKLGYIKIFGNGDNFGIFLTTFLGILVFITILFVIKLWRTGFPD